MTDLSHTITPKSDQLNYDDLLTGAITVKVTRVEKADGEQPVVVHIDGGYQPYKPCKSMRRVLIATWGKDGDKWIGQRMTLYGDPTVKWAGQEVGGIRISHMSGIDKPRTYQLTITRGKRQQYTVKPLPVEPSQTDRCRQWLTKNGIEIDAAENLIGKRLDQATTADFARIGKMA